MPSPKESDWLAAVAAFCFEIAAWAVVRAGMTVLFMWSWAKPVPTTVVGVEGCDDVVGVLFALGAVGA